MANDLKFSIFTKPWRAETPDELAELVKNLGFDGIEFPLRDGYQAEPASAETELPKLAAKFLEYGLKIYSIASGTEENIFAACAEASVPLIRIMFGHDLNRNYHETEREMKKTIEGFLPLCEKYRIKVGVQQHCGPGVNNSMEMLHLLEGYDPKLVGGVWDAAHSGLAGEEPEQALDVIWDYLCLVNFKNAAYIRTNGPEADEAAYDRYFTTGSQGLCSWRRALAHLNKKGYAGNICMPVEYTDYANTEKYAYQDLIYIKKLAREVYGPDCC